ncbi:putative outer membrane starch-binding protein [Bacteroides zoogleoformans]|uniref:RagB/SusD family nutrient uptake outer membrane protein n=1 Tax=Bacteroides zoogleoformans TaxID=28119 RepID=A0ABM6T5Y6_9BACE|nr:RagB/SusD family nutrient uptake outer membrane protein [Bacteroides zoogleoformans]AVM52017.1 RagB/SusD family nutrient uptake outer membrane protein [Bacteroides zoogleoformans]TWJ13943.1 putative outer membrane starch-binding protein [Bacteroides zoogleoformans]
MKKKLLYGIFALGIAATTLTSCEDMFGDFLDKQPSGELTGEEVFGDWGMMTQFHNDTYNFLRHGACRINRSWLDAATDLGETSYANGGVRTTFNIGNYYGGGGATELSDTWEVFYRGIRKCNMILTRIESVPRGAELSESDYLVKKQNYISEARFLRAWFYWELFLRYGPIPVVTEVLDPNGDLLGNYTTRPTLKEYVVDFILKELKECEDGLQPNDKNYKEYGRINRPMARALHSHIMLYMASPRYSAESSITWQQAADANKSFIDTYGGLYSLMQGVDAKTALTNAWLLTPAEGNKEMIFYRNDNTITWSGISNDTPVGEGGNGGLCPSQNLIDMYDMIDGNAPFQSYDETGAPVYNGMQPIVNPNGGYSDANMWSNRDRRLNASILFHGVIWGNGTINVVKGQRDNPLGNANATPTGYYVRKLIPESILSNNHGGKAYRIWSFIRYSEILLNYAEAVNEVEGPCEEVYKALDQIRHRAGITGNVADRTDLDTKEKMRNFIRKERTIELAFEEHRPWDVRRWNVAEKALGRDIIGIDVAADGSITRKVAQKRVFSEKMYLYPIPEGEYWKTGIKNNPGW